jgi:hypothetical protein
VARAQDQEQAIGAQASRHHSFFYTTLTLGSVVNLSRTGRNVAVAFLAAILIVWVLNFTIFSANRPLPGDKVPGHPLGLGSPRTASLTVAARLRQSLDHPIDILRADVEVR